MDRAYGTRPSRPLVISSKCVVVYPSYEAYRPHTQIESLDIFLPLLLLSGPSSTPSSLAVATSTAQMLASSVRSEMSRRAVTEWLPPSERQREIKSRRGWEKTAALSASQAAPWIARQLLTLLGDPKREVDVKVRVFYLSSMDDA